MYLKVNKTEALKMVKLFRWNTVEEKGWENNVIDFMGDKKEVGCVMYLGGGHWGHVSACLQLDNGHTTLEQKRCGDMSLFYNPISIVLVPNDKRIKPFITLMKDMSSGVVPAVYIKRCMKRYLEGKCTVEQLMELATQRYKKDTVLKEELKKNDVYINHVNSGMLRSYYSGTKTLEEVIRVAILTKMRVEGKR